MGSHLIYTLHADYVNLLIQTRRQSSKRQQHQQWLHFPLHVTMEAGWQDFFFFILPNFSWVFFASVETLK